MSDTFEVRCGEEGCGRLVGSATWHDGWFEFEGNRASPWDDPWEQAHFECKRHGGVVVPHDVVRYHARAGHYAKRKKVLIAFHEERL